MGKHRKYKYRVTIVMKDGGTVPMGADTLIAAQATKRREEKNPQVKKVEIKPW